MTSLIGQGYYGHGHAAGDPAYILETLYQDTAYTPYQPEIAQGRPKRC